MIRISVNQRAYKRRRHFDVKVNVVVAMNPDNVDSKSRRENLYI